MHVVVLFPKRLSFNEDKPLGNKNINSFSYDSISHGEGKKSLIKDDNLLK
jgi:hypothetical protein